MFVDVAEEGALDHLLGAHRRHPREHGAALLELGVGEAPDDRGRRGGPLLVERDRLRLGAAGELLGMLGVHLVEHLGGEVRQRLAGGDRLDDVGDRLVASGDVVRRYADRPPLGGRRLLPVGIGQLLQEGCGLLHLGLELPGIRFSLGSHGVASLVCVPHCIDERRDSRSTGPVTDLALLRCRKKAGRCRWVPATPGASVVDRLILSDQAAGLRGEGGQRGPGLRAGSACTPGRVRSGL